MTQLPSQRDLITRDELVRIVDEASRGITESTREKVLEVARTTSAVACGWWHCDGVQCPMRQAGRITNQAFQQAFDEAMAARFDRDYLEAFVVQVAS